MTRSDPMLTALRNALALSIAVLCVAGCQSLSDGAKEAFAKENTCPLDRIETRERPELKVSTFETARAAPSAIGADPARLKMWQAEQADRTERGDSGHRYIQVRGCDKAVLYNCRGPTNEDRPQRPWVCSEQRNVSAALSKW